MRIGIVPEESTGEATSRCFFSGSVPAAGLVAAELEAAERLDAAELPPPACPPPHAASRRITAGNAISLHQIMLMSADFRPSSVLRCRQIDSEQETGIWPRSGTLPFGPRMSRLRPNCSSRSL